MDTIIPLTMKFRRDDFNARKILIADHYSGFVVAGVQSGAHHQPGLRRRMGNEIYDHLVAGQRATTPVLGDKAEEAVFDFVPFAGAWRKMADGDAQRAFVGEFLEFQ